MQATAKLSRRDSTLITSAKWVRDPKEISLYWWTVTLDATGAAAFRTWGIHTHGGPPDRPWRETPELREGTTIRLSALSYVPVATGLIAFAQTATGPVLAAIGRVRDRFEAHCGPMVYLIPRCQTRSDTIDPSAPQMAALRSALEVLMRDGVDAAERSLRASDLFDNIFQSNEGCPHFPAGLPDGVWEWH